MKMIKEIVNDTAAANQVMLQCCVHVAKLLTVEMSTAGERKGRRES